MPALWSDPPGVPGVACRRGTCGCPGIMSEPGAERLSIPRQLRRPGVDQRSAAHERFALFCASTGERSDPTRLGRVILWLRLSFYPPAFVGSPKQRARPSARLCDGVGSAGRPRAPSRAPQQPARSAADAPLARTAAVLPPSAKHAESPQLRLALANARQALHSKAEWGHGVGRHARQMRGEIVSTCKELRVRSRSPRVQTGLYRSIVPESRRPSFSI